MPSKTLNLDWQQDGNAEHFLLLVFPWKRKIIISCRKNHISKSFGCVSYLPRMWASGPWKYLFLIDKWFPGIINISTDSPAADNFFFIGSKILIPLSGFTEIVKVFYRESLLLYCVHQSVERGHRDTPLCVVVVTAALPLWPEIPTVWHLQGSEGLIHPTWCHH